MPDITEKYITRVKRLRGRFVELVRSLCEGTKVFLNFAVYRSELFHTNLFGKQFNLMTHK